MKKIFINLIIIFIGLTANASEATFHKLNNGHSVIIKEVKDNPIVIIDTWVKTGSINETDENNGVAHFLEHLFFKGTEKYPAREFDTILESKGAITNAATSKDYTHYYILIPSKYFDLALDLHSDMLSNPLIPRKELEKERKVVLEEISKNNDKPTTILYKNMIKGFYKVHPYKRDVIGTKEVIETISREQIFDFYNKWYTPNNMTTVIVGDVDSQKVLEQIAKKFNKQSNTKRSKQIVYKKDKKPVQKIENIKNLNVQTAYILMGYKGCYPVSNKDSYALDVLATILGDGKSSRLYKELKEHKQIVHSISAVHSSMKDDSIFYISANYATDDVEKIKNSIFSEIEKIKRNGISEEEIQKAKNIIERDTFYSRESVSNIAEELGYISTITGNISYYDNYLNNINKVSAKDIQRIAKDYLDNNSVVISIIEPLNQEIQEKTTQKIKEHYKANLISKNKNTFKYSLENGANFIITKNQANDIVALEISIIGGNNLESKAGIGSIVAEVMKKGTSEYTKQEFSQILEENGIRLATDQKGDFFTISAKFTKNQKELVFNILSEIINNAKLDPTEIEKVKKDKLVSFKTMKNYPETLAFDEFKTALWQGTPYGNTAKILEKTIPSIEPKDVQTYYKNLFSPQNTIITVNGNVDEKEYIDYFSQVFKKNDNKKINLDNYASKFKSLRENKIVKIDKNSNATWLLYGWLTDGNKNTKDWATLQVIDALLGSGMSSRLFVNLRDEQGLAYQVGSSYSAAYNNGVFAIYIATNPQSVLQAKNGIFNEISKLKKEFITEKELSEAKDKLIGNFILSLETNTDKAAMVNSFEVYNKGYDFIEKYPDLINSVTVQDIIKTANKYFNSPYVFTVLGNKKSIDKL